MGDFTEMLATFNRENLLTTAIQENQNTFKLSAAPNPTNGYVYISADRIIRQSAIYNLNGPVLQSGTYNLNKISLDLSTLVKGMYMLRCTDAHGIQEFVKIAVQ